jgi:outer membrane protein insertion porin family
MIAVLLVLLTIESTQGICKTISFRGSNTSEIPSLWQRAAPNPPLIEDVELRGNRRIPRETILKQIKSKAGDRYDERQARKDLETIASLGFFDPLYTRLFTDRGPRDGIILVFVVQEYPLIRAVVFEGLKSVSETDVLARLKAHQIDISTGSYCTADKIKTATDIILELLAEKKQPSAKVHSEIQHISHTTVILIFKINE